MSLINAITSPKGAVLLVPAILLVGGTLFIGKKVEPAAPQARAAAPVAAPSQAATTASPPTQPAAAPSAPSQSTAAAPEKPAGGSTFSADPRKELHSIMKEFADELYRPTGSPIVGNVMGDVPIVEFFDYNCGFCKKAFPDVAKLMEKDKKVRVILKEFPILSKGSEEASRVALAATMQGKYWEFHRAMLEVQGQATEASALRTAEKLGLDMPRIKKDMASAEVKKEIEDTRKLAAKIGIQGTPHFIVGDRVIAGAPENLGEMLDKHLSDVRKEGC